MSAPHVCASGPVPFAPAGRAWRVAITGIFFARVRPSRTRGGAAPPFHPPRPGDDAPMLIEITRIACDGEVLLGIAREGDNRTAEPLCFTAEPAAGALPAGSYTLGLASRGSFEARYGAQPRHSPLGLLQIAALTDTGGRVAVIRPPNQGGELPRGLIDVGLQATLDAPMRLYRLADGYRRLYDRCTDTERVSVGLGLPATVVVRGLAA